MQRERLPLQESAPRFPLVPKGSVGTSSEIRALPANDLKIFPDSTL
jgi:hypothetical protein